MRALVIQHDHVSPPGPVGDRLLEHGIESVLHQIVPRDRFATPDVVTDFPRATSFDLVVVMGAPWSAYDLDTIGSWLLPELDLLREADRGGVPTLGICFGGQLLATAFGGSVQPSIRPEVGWTTISSDAPDLVATGPWFQWHLDSWVLPQGAVEIARNAVASQAFTLRQHLAVQFHPELTPGMLAGWLGNGGGDLARDLGLDPEQMMRQTLTQESAARRRAHELVDAFLAHSGLHPDH